mgnify:CR=1 FL=1
MRGIPGDTDDGAEANDPLIGASVEPVRRTPTPLMPEEVDAIRTAYAGGVSTGFGSESRFDARSAGRSDSGAWSSAPMAIAAAVLRGQGSSRRWSVSAGSSAA